jgi:hypothetical protein
MHRLRLLLDDGRRTVVVLRQLPRPPLGALTIGTMAAKTVRFSNQGDVLSKALCSMAEAVGLSLPGNVYEPLITRDVQVKLAWALAVRWILGFPTSAEKLTSPNDS